MSQLASDDFNRANGGLGANWTTTTSEQAPTITSNEVVDGGALVAGARYTGIAWPANQYAEILVGSVVSTTSDEGVGPAARIASAAQTHYLGQSNTVETRLYKCVSGGFTQLGSDAAASATGNTLRLIANGSSISLAKNSVTVVGPVTDSSIASGDAGIWCTNLGAGTIDSFAGGDLLVASAAAPFVVPWLKSAGGLPLMGIMAPPPLPDVAAATTIAIPLSDSAAGSDSVSIAATETPSDSAAGSDVATVAAALSPADAATGSESEVTGLVISDSAAGADASTLGTAIVSTDAAAGSDSASLAVAITAADAATGSDSASVDTGGTPVALSDSAAGAEAIAIGAALSGADTSASGDATALVVVLSSADTAAGSDSATKGLQLGDSGSGLEALVTAIVALLADSAQGSDNIVVGGAPPQVPEGRRSITLTSGPPRADVRTGLRRSKTSTIRRT